MGVRNHLGLVLSRGPIIPGERHAMADTKKLVFAFVTLLIVFGIVELVAFVAAGLLQNRGVFYQPQDVDRYDHYLAMRDPELGWLMSRGMASDEIDSAGSRFVPAYPEPGNECMSVYGDSFAWSAEVAPKDSMNNLLSQKMACRVSNYAVGGYGSDQAYMRFLRREQERAPIVILAHTTVTILRNVNQFRRLLSPWNEYGLKPRFVLDERGELEVVPLPKFTKEQFEKLSKRPPDHLEHEYFGFENPTVVRVLSFPYSLSVLSTFGDFRVKAELANRPGHSEFYDMQHPSQGLPITVKIMEGFDREARRRNRMPLPLIIPIGSDFEYYMRTGEWVFQPLIDELAARGVDAFNPGPGMVERLSGRDICELVTGERCTGHFNAMGYSLLADEVYDELQRRGFLSRLESLRRENPAGAIPIEN